MRTPDIRVERPFAGRQANPRAHCDHRRPITAERTSVDDGQPVNAGATRSDDKVVGGAVVVVDVVVESGPVINPAIQT